MSFFIQVLCTDSIDSTACTIIGTDSYRIIVNCGEGVQRLCVEHKVRLGKISAVLFTDDCPSHCFGLPGIVQPVLLFVLCILKQNIFKYRLGADIGRRRQFQNCGDWTHPHQQLTYCNQTLHETARPITPTRTY